jgi:hypothetical protein
VPAQDWSFISEEAPEFCLQKSAGKNGDGRGGHLKQLVAISANGMKHLLAASLGVLTTQPSQTHCGTCSSPYSLRSHDG